MSADFFMLWNIIGSVIFIVLILLHLTLKNAKQEERKRKELEKRRKDRLEEKYLREKKKLRELLLGLSINESQVVREAMLNSSPGDRHLVYNNYTLGFHVFEIYDYDIRRTFYVIYDTKYHCFYYNIWTRNYNDMIKIVEYHRNLKK